MNQLWIPLDILGSLLMATGTGRGLEKTVLETLEPKNLFEKNHCLRITTNFFFIKSLMKDNYSFKILFSCRKIINKGKARLLYYAMSGTRLHIKSTLISNTKLAFCPK